MKKILLIFSLVFTSSIFSQNISGNAEYTLKLSDEAFKKQVFSDSNMDPIMRKFIEEKMQKKLQKKFILTFNNFASVYEEKETVEIKNDISDLSWSPYGIDVSIFEDLRSIKWLLKKI